VNGIIPLPDGRFFFVYKHNLYTTKQKWIDLSLKRVGPDWQQVQLHSVINSVNDSSKCLILLGVVCKQEMCTFLLGCSNNYYLLKSQSDGQGTPSAVNITNLSKDPNQIKVSHCQEIMVFAHFEG
jgi:hypothetical protein